MEATTKPQRLVYPNDGIEGIDELYARITQLRGVEGGHWIIDELFAYADYPEIGALQTERAWLLDKQNGR
ncbi:MAG: hypothetical protein GY711_22400 [bacterium]|nr:hypothetical protein [bacterium]